MITRAKLVEQLREYQIRSHHKYSALVFFSPKPQIRSCLLDTTDFLIIIVVMLYISKADVTVALLLSALFGILVVSSLVTLYFRHFWLCLLIICISIFIPLRLRNSRKSLARKRERRMLLPLSM